MIRDDRPTIERFIRGRYAPSFTHWRITKIEFSDTPWEVLEPSQLRGTFLPPPALFATYEEARAFVAGKVTEFARTLLPDGRFTGATMALLLHQSWEPR